MRDQTFSDDKVKYILFLYGKKNKISAKYHLLISILYGTLGGVFASFVVAGFGDSIFGFFIGFAIYDATTAIKIARVEDEIVKYEYLWPKEHEQAREWLAKNT